MERLLSFFNWFIRANATSLSCAVSVADTKLDDLFPFTHSLCQHKIFFLFFRFFHLSYETENQEACEILRQCSQCSPFGNNWSIFIFFFFNEYSFHRRLRLLWHETMYMRTHQIHIFIPTRNTIGVAALKHFVHFSKSKRERIHERWKILMRQANEKQINMKQNKVKIQICYDRKWRIFQRREKNRKKERRCI